MRVALGLEYEGTDFAGWQTQPAILGLHTVQDTLQAALASVASERIEVFCSGRTDAGVHALQQVVHFDTSVSRPLQAWVRGTNSALPRSVSVRWAMPVLDTFHARHSALERRYTYVLHSAAVRPVNLRRHVAWTHLALDVHAMQKAAHLLLGEHDFTSFRALQCQAKSPVRHLSHIQIVQHGSYYVCTLQANGFLHHMVRNIMGALVYVGSGRWSVDQFNEVFLAKNRQIGAPTFAPQGLYFCGAIYPTALNIPAPRVLQLLG